MVKKYPIGMQSFEAIRTGGYAYVDKTDIIFRLVNHTKYNFLSRPRRFGKSLLLSTLKAYFEGKKSLFEGLAIAGLEQDWIQYPVLHMSLNGVNYHEPSGLAEKIGWSLRQWELEYGIDKPAQSLGVRLSEVVIRAKKQTGLPVVLLVDEYEKPILDMIGDPEKQDCNRQELNGFYSNIKDLDDYLRFVLFTGVTKIGKLSVFSALNNLNELTFDDRYATLCGISEQEIHDNFEQDVLALAEKQSVSLDEMYALLKKQYDGYHFSEEMCGVYNPFSLLNALDKQKIGDYWFSTGTPSYLVELFKRNRMNLLSLEDLHYSMAQLSDVDSFQRDVIPLLYQSGYLTLIEFEKRFGRYKLGFPNSEVERGMMNFFIPFYCQTRQTTEFDIPNFVADVEEARVDAFMQRISSLLADTPYEIERDLEVHFQNFFYLLFKLMGYYVRVEYQTNVGRIDMVIQTDKYIYIIEFKMGRSAKLALNQIKKNGYALPFMSDPRRKFLVGANFSVKLRGMGKFVIETVE